MFKKCKIFSILIFSIISLNVGAADYSKAINLAGKQRMLTQKMSKEVILISLDINKDENLENLKNTRNLFDKTLKGLQNGDADLGLSPTKKPKIIKKLKKDSKKWASFDKQISSIISSGNVSDAQLKAVMKENMPLLKQMHKTVKFYVAAVSSKGSDKSIAKSINLAGKQRMLTQKMSKEFFMIAHGKDADANKLKLEKTVHLFDKTLKGLMLGDASLGLVPAPNAEIKAQLEKVNNMWKEFHKHIKSFDSQDSWNYIESNNIPLLKEMNAAVQMFVKL